MYIIIGGDQKEYGPITANDVREWMAEGRLNEASLIKKEGEAEFRPLISFPEFASASVVGTPSSPASERHLSERDYELDMGGCISRGWGLVKNNFGLLFVASLVVMLIEGAISGLGSIPLIGPLFSIANLILAGPLMGGLYYVFIHRLRDEPAEVGDVFAGFRNRFGQLILGHIVPALLAGLCLIPVVIVGIITVLPLLTNAQHGQLADPQALANELSKIPKTSLLLLVGAFLVCVIPMIYLQVCWAFTLPLIIDKQTDFWTAMTASRTMVKKHWWHVFGLTVLIGLLNVVGVLLCCVGVLFTIPIGFAALMYAYETIFSEG